MLEKHHEADFAEVAAVSAGREPNGRGMGSFPGRLQERRLGGDRPLGRLLWYNTRVTRRGLSPDEVEVFVWNDEIMQDNVKGGRDRP